jgi:hypothetical protein
MTDDDWAQMSMLLRAYQAGGEEALKKAMNELREKDQSCFSRVAKAIEAWIKRGSVTLCQRSAAPFRYKPDTSFLA